MRALIALAFPTFGGLALLAGCAGAKPATDHRASAVAIEVPEAPPAAGPARFRPDPPLVALLPASEVATKSCKTEDVVLGDASDVVTGGGDLYPVSVAFGPAGGLAAWMHRGKIVSRSIDRDGQPRGAVVEGPTWRRGPRVFASKEGFVLAEVDGANVLVLAVRADGSPAGGPWSVRKSPWLNVSTLLLTGERELTLVGASRADGEPKAHLGVFTIDFAGAEPRTELHGVAMEHMPAADSVFVPGAYGQERALVIAWPSKELALLRGDALQPLPAEELSREVDRYLDLVPFGLGSSSGGYDYGVVARTTYPRLPFDEEPTPSTVKVRLADPEWLGLGEPVWTGTRFVMSRLSGAEPRTEARLFVMNCR